MDDVRLASVVFYVRSHEVAGKTGRVVLDATVNDAHVWSRVVERLQGMRLFGVADLDAAVVDILKDDLETLKAEHEHKVQELTARAELAEYRLSVLASKSTDAELLDAANKVRESIERISVPKC